MLTDADILQRLTNVEDATVERKVASDLRDVVKTAVAFSNSLPIGDPGIIYFGVYNDGRPEGFLDNAVESHLKKLSGELSNIYPPIAPQLLARKTAEGSNFIAVIVSGSPLQSCSLSRLCITVSLVTMLSGSTCSLGLRPSLRASTFIATATNDYKVFKGKTDPLVACPKLSAYN